VKIKSKLNQELEVLFPQEATEKIKLVSLEEKIRELAATQSKNDDHKLQ